MAYKEAVFLFIFSFLLISCSKSHQQIASIKEETITNIDLNTEDNIKIKGTFFKGNKGMPSLILLHMLDRNRKDWNEFALSLQMIGFNVISIDFRGHGESGLSWKKFSDGDFNNMISDVKVANDYLIKQGLNNNVAIIGASIGANIALNYAANYSKVKTIILLSPGLDFRGVKTKDSIKQFKNPVLIVAAEDDSYSADSSKTLNSSSKNSTLKIYNGSEHGTQLLMKTDVDKLIADWLKENLK